MHVGQRCRRSASCRARMCIDFMAVYSARRLYTITQWFRQIEEDGAFQWNDGNIGSWTELDIAIFNVGLIFDDCVKSLCRCTVGASGTFSPADKAQGQTSCTKRQILSGLSGWFPAARPTDIWSVIFIRFLPCVRLLINDRRLDSIPLASFYEHAIKGATMLDENPHNTKDGTVEAVSRP